MRINTHLLLIALLQIKLTNSLLWKLPIIYELNKNNKGSNDGFFKKFSICEKKNNNQELSTNPDQKKILIIPPIEEPLDWECGEISWDLDDDTNKTSVKNNPTPTPPQEPSSSLPLHPVNVAFLFI